MEIPGAAPRDLVMTADTLWIDTDRALCTLTWRGQVAVDGPAQQGRVLVALEEAGQHLTWADISGESPVESTPSEAPPASRPRRPQPTLPFVPVRRRPRRPRRPIAPRAPTTTSRRARTPRKAGPAPTLQMFADPRAGGLPVRLGRAPPSSAPDAVRASPGRRWSRLRRRAPERSPCARGAGARARARLVLARAAGARAPDRGVGAGPARGRRAPPRSATSPPCSRAPLPIRRPRARALRVGRRGRRALAPARGAGRRALVRLRRGRGAPRPDPRGEAERPRRRPARRAARARRRRWRSPSSRRSPEVAADLCARIRDAWAQANPMLPAAPPRPAGRAGARSAAARTSGATCSARRGSARSSGPRTRPSPARAGVPAGGGRVAAAALPALPGAAPRGGAPPAGSVRGEPGDARGDGGRARSRARDVDQNDASEHVGTARVSERTRAATVRADSSHNGVCSRSYFGRALQLCGYRWLMGWWPFQGQ